MPKTAISSTPRYTNTLTQDELDRAIDNHRSIWVQEHGTTDKTRWRLERLEPAQATIAKMPEQLRYEASLWLLSELLSGRFEQVRS